LTGSIALHFRVRKDSSRSSRLPCQFLEAEARRQPHLFGINVTAEETRLSRQGYKVSGRAKAAPSITHAGVAIGLIETIARLSDAPFLPLFPVGDSMESSGPSDTLANGPNVEKLRAMV
jgi:hypothetical protein